MIEAMLLISNTHLAKDRTWAVSFQLGKVHRVGESLRSLMGTEMTTIMTMGAFWSKLTTLRSLMTKK